MHVVCLIGTSRCGSTVLQAALAQFQGVTALGEIKRLRSLAARGALCGCGAKLDACEVWGPHVADFVAPTGGRLRMLGNTLAVATGAPLFPADAQAAQSLSQMLHAIDRKLPSRVFIDSSKDPDQLLLYASRPDVTVIPVHVVRDPRGVVQSAGRRTGTTADVMARHWHRLNAATLILRKMTPRLPWQTVRYEDFCADPMAICSAILRAAGHDGQLRDWPSDHDDFGSNRSKIINVIDSNKLEHDVVRKPLRTFRHHAVDHTLGGSPGFSFGGIDTIRVENNWQGTMPAQIQATILRQSGWPARHFGYRFDSNT